jgi:UDP:flavonoid glycosyltransferase YjiC (YdhE family)
MMREKLFCLAGMRGAAYRTLKGWLLLQHYCDVPVSYCWSPTLLPCPSDWPPNAEVVGFCQLEASQRMQYQPPEDLKQFLAAGKPPVYIGFGSMTLSKAKVCELTFTMVVLLPIR